MDFIKNWWVILIMCVFTLLAGMSNGRMDTVQFHYSGSKYAKKGNDLYYNPAISWANKYKTDEKGSFIRDENGELQRKFFLSTTALVMFTDFWHLQQFFMGSFFILAMVTGLLFSRRIKKEDDIEYWYYFILTPIIMFVMFKGVFSLGFYLTYH